MSELELKQKTELLKQVMNTASGVALVDNLNAFVESAVAVTSLENALSEPIVKSLFYPLMNKRSGFKTDRTGLPNWKGEVKPLYSIAEVKQCVVEAVLHGLYPTSNHFNIIAGNMYITKEGFTHLLKKLGVKYKISVGYDISKDLNIASIPVTFDFKYKTEEYQKFNITISLKKGKIDGLDQLRGKAERRAKKAIYEFLTGMDLPESNIEDVEAVDITKGEPVQQKTETLNVFPQKDGSNK